MFVWMCVTQDKYELPLCIADTASELGKILGVSANSIIKEYYRYTNGKVNDCKYRKVEIEED